MNRLDELSRTIALLGGDLGITSASAVDQALLRHNVLLSIGHPASTTRAGQAAILTAAMLIVRSGHRVYIICNDGPLVGHQPPFSGATIFEAVQSVRGELISGSDIRFQTPDRVDIAFDFGTTSCIAPFTGGPTYSVGWGAWFGEIARWPNQMPCTEFDWPMGAMAAAVLVAAEVTKFAVRLLAPISANPAMARAMFQSTPVAILRLASEDVPKNPYVGEFTAISAGAVSNALFYALARLPDVHGRAAVFDDDMSEASNLNRNMLLLRMLLGRAKTDVLDHFSHGLRIDPVRKRFVEDDLDDLSGRVAVGVDHVPTRWLLARGQYDWMGVGATSHFNALNSVHYLYSGCPACLHPHDEPGPEITPTISHVSFLAGLQLAADLIIDIAGTSVGLESRQRYVSTNAFGKPDAVTLSGVFPRRDCPAQCPASLLRAA